MANFDWVKPYNEDEEISSGAGFLSGSNGFPLSWKLKSPNYGRLKRKAIYQFETNNQVYTGSGNRDSIVKTATVQQHGQPVFDIDHFAQDVIGNTLSPTIVFNLADSTVPSGVISIDEDAYTNAQFFEISITPSGSSDTWSQGQNSFTQVSWVSNNLLRADYFNGVRDTTYYRFNANRPSFYGTLDSYQGLDYAAGIRNSYMFRMVYQNATTKISTGSTGDITEYFSSTTGVTSIDFNSLNSAQLQFTDNNNVSRTFKEYYHNLLVAGEESKFGFQFYTNVNSLIKSDNAFDLFCNSDGNYYIDTTHMLHFTITITPYGYKEKLDNITTNSIFWTYPSCVINVYIINCPLNPYLFLNTDNNEQDYVSSPIDANGGKEEMPVFSNRGWDITPSGTTEYVGYNE